MKLHTLPAPARLAARWRQIAFALTLSTLAAAALAATDPKASRLYEDALQRFEKKDHAGAIIQLKNALQVDKTLLPVHVLLGKALLETREFRAAEVAFDEALKLGVSPAEVAVPLAKVQLALGKGQKLLEPRQALEASLPATARYELLILKSSAADSLSDRKQALRLLEEARALNPSSPDAWSAEASLWVRSGDLAKAKVAADKAVSVAPSQAQPLYVRGTVSHAQGRLPEARDYYDRALKVAPDHLESFVAKAGIQLDLSRPADAKRDIAEALKIDPSEPRALYMSALIAEQEGRQSEAKSLLSQAATVLHAAPIEFLRTRPQLLMVAGMSNFSLGQFEKAKPYFDAYLRDQPASPVAKAQARILLQEGYGDRAAEVLDLYVRSHPRDVQGVLLLASAQLAQGRTTRAVQQLQSAIKTDPRPEYQHALGMAYWRAGQLRLAVSEFEGALKRDPKNLPIGMALASLYLQLKQPKRALDIVRPQLEKYPKDAGVQYLLGRALAGTGDFPAAKAAYAKATELDPKLLDAQVDLARVEARLNEMPQALARVDKVIATDAKHVGALVLAGELTERAGKLDVAQTWFEKAADHSGPTELDPGIRLVEFHLTHRRPDRAAEALKRLTAKAPESVRVLIAQARVALSAGDATAARSALSRASTAAVDSDTLGMVAELQLTAEDAAGTAHTAGKILKETPGHIGATSLLSAAELRRQNYPEAERLAQEVVRASPKRGVGYVLLGDVANARGQTAQAVDAYRRAHQFDNDSRSAQRLFPVLAQRDPAEAIRFAEQWVKTRPNDPSMWRSLADTQARTSNWQAARRSYEELLKLTPNDAEVMNNLANVLLFLKDPGALAMAEKAHSIKPDAPHIVSTLGWASHRAGQNDRALQLLRDARLRNPNSGDTRFYLATVLASVGRANDARSELEGALTLDASFMHAKDARALLASLK